MTVHGRESLDEISISGETVVGELKDGRVTEYVIHPAQFGLAVHDSRVLRVDTVEQSRDMVLSALADTPGAARDIVALNAGAAIYVAGVAPTLEEGVERAFAAIASGAARATLDAFVGWTARAAAAAHFQ